MHWYWNVSRWRLHIKIFLLSENIKFTVKISGLDYLWGVQTCSHILVHLWCMKSHSLLRLAYFITVFTLVSYHPCMNYLMLNSVGLITKHLITILTLLITMCRASLPTHNLLTVFSTDVSTECSMFIMLTSCWCCYLILDIYRNMIFIWIVSGKMVDTWCFLCFLK